MLIKFLKLNSSRLACCVLVEKWMNEMIVTIGGNADPNDENYV